MWTLKKTTRRGCTGQFASAAEAIDAHNTARDESGLGARDWGAHTLISPAGRHFTISYNGRVWSNPHLLAEATRDELQG